MKHSCSEIEEALWESARSGSELAEHVLRHVAGCPACARAFKEAKQILCASSDNYASSAPDCRAAVMARIGIRGKARWAWAYACAAVAVLAVIAGGLTLRAPSPGTRQAVRPTPVVRRLPHVDQPKRIVVVPSSEIKRQPPPSRDRTIVRTPRLRRAPKPIPSRRPIVAAVPPLVADEVPPTQQEPTPVAAVIVTGIVNDQSPDMSYGYRERDPVTGVTTECSVTRTGDSIEIHMESTPAGDPQPVKGSLSHENTNNA